MLTLNQTGRSADRHESAVKLESAVYARVAAAFRAGNATGEGYPVGDEGADINALSLGTLVHEAQADDELAVYETAAGCVAVAWGAWAVTVSA